MKRVTRLLGHHAPQPAMGLGPKTLGPRTRNAHTQQRPWPQPKYCEYPKLSSDRSAFGRIWIGLKISDLSKTGEVCVTSI